MRAKKMMLIVVLAVIALGAAAYIRQHNQNGQVGHTQGNHDLYYCPMHPQILYDHAGRCPSCRAWT